MEYLSLPLVLREGYLSRATIEESIIYSIGLILSTRVGRIPFMLDYGCNLWEREYSDMMTANKADVRASLRNAIDAFEKRLYNVSVSFANLSDHSANSLGIIIKVSGNYRDGNQEKKLQHNYRVG